MRTSCLCLQPVTPTINNLFTIYSGKTEKIAFVICKHKQIKRGMQNQTTSFYCWDLKPDWQMPLPGSQSRQDTQLRSYSPWMLFRKPGTSRAQPLHHTVKQSSSSHKSWFLACVLGPVAWDTRSGQKLGCLTVQKSPINCQWFRLFPALEE